MTLPSSGSITLAQVAAELGQSLPIDLNSAPVRALAGKPTGSVVMPTDFYGKSSFSVTFNIGAQTSSLGGPTANRFMVFRRNITVVVNGGTGYSYAWSVHSAVTGNASPVGLNSATTSLQSTDWINEWEDGDGYDEIVLKVVLSGGTQGNGTYYTPVIYMGG